MIDPSWLLFDDFLTAGVNAAPGPGVRTITDTNNALSFVGGRAEFAAGGVAVGNPGLWYPSMSLDVGLILQTKLNFNGIGFEFGFDASATGNIYNGLRGSGVALQARIANGTVPVGTLVASTEYQFTVIQRGVGFAGFVKGGTYTNWTLVWISDLGVSFAPLPGLVVTGGTAVFSVDFIRSPDLRWLPAPLVSDGFSTTNSDGLGHAETSGVGSGGAGVVWTGATWTNVGGKAKNTPTLIGSELVVNGNMETGDPPSTWTAVSSPTLDGVADERTGGAGAQSLSMINGIAAAGGVSQALGLSAGKWILATVWARRINASPRMIIATNSYVTLTTINTSNTAWTQLIATARLTDTGRVWILSNTSSIGLECRFDDCSVKELALADLFRSVTASTADVMASAELNPYVTGTQGGIYLNLDSTSNPQNLVLCVLDGSNIKLEKCVAGTWTTLINVAFTYVAGKKLIVWKLGSKYRVYYNDTLIGTEQTISDTGIINNTRHGKFSTDAANEFDNFLVYAVTSSDYDNALNVTYTRTPTGIFSFSGLIRRLLNRRVTGGFSFSGILTYGGIGSAIKRVVSLTGRWLTTVRLRGRK